MNTKMQKYFQKSKDFSKTIKPQIKAKILKNQKRKMKMKINIYLKINGIFRTEISKFRT
jgi:hypothetical protein